MANAPHHRTVNFLTEIDVVGEYLVKGACPVALRPADVFAGAGLRIAGAKK